MTNKTSSGAFAALLVCLTFAVPISAAETTTNVDAVSVQGIGFVPPGAGVEACGGQYINCIVVDASRSDDDNYVQTCGGSGNVFVNVLSSSSQQNICNQDQNGTRAE